MVIQKKRGMESFNTGKVPAENIIGPAATELLKGLPSPTHIQMAGQNLEFFPI